MAEPAALEAKSYSWIRFLRIYLPGVAVGNLVWEGAHLPLYTIWKTGTSREQAFAVIHCTGGDVLIALSSLTLALLLIGDERWPRSRFVAVAIIAMVFGIAYTVFSEWLNVVVRGTWAYSEYMPVVSVGGFSLGLSPIAQWIVVPAVVMAISRQLAKARQQAAQRG
jgi:hypothetical protein